MDVYDSTNSQSNGILHKIMRITTKSLSYVFFAFIFLLIGWWVRGQFIQGNEFLIAVKTNDRPLDKYSFDSLSKSEIAGEVKITSIVEEEETYTSYLFDFTHYPDLDTSNPAITTGLINLPNEPNGKLIMQLRGYVDPSIYSTGVGTRNSGRFYADKGYITIAPDFLGYAGSDGNAADIFESRFQTYTTALQLLKTLEKIKDNPKLIELDEDLEEDPLSNFQITNVYLWGHSNGGQIALSLLEITGEEYPTTLWAPVTKGFPYSILYFTDESADRGKFIRKELADFERLYDVDNYSLDQHFDKINAKLQIHQGTADDAVPVEWTDETVSILKSNGIDVNYLKYPDTDHNLRPNWDDVVEKDLEFFEAN